MIAINWFDVLPVAITFLSIIFVQVLNVYLHILNDNGPAKNVDKVDSSEVECLIRSSLNGNTSPSPSATARGSQTPTLSNGKLEKQTSLLDCDSHEDEDTLSLENLFPCDQTEIYASKKISFIIDELIQTEVNYVNNLRKGLDNYGKLQLVEDLPEALRGEQRQQHLLGNIEEILELHEQQILPLMLRNQRDLKALFDELATHFEKNSFYCYVSFTMGKKVSMQLRQENREWLQSYQTLIKDKLGIDSFLVQPIQRLTRYPLLLQQFISEFYKNGISCKPVLSAVCKLETRMRRQLDVVNQAEEIHSIEELNEFDLHQQGQFRRSTEFEAQHFPTRKKYRAKVFLFERCLVCTEVRKKRLAYRQHYNWEHVELQRPLELATANANKIINLLVKQPDKERSKREEYSFVASEAAVVKQWLLATHRIIEIARHEQLQRDTFSLPMDLVLGVLLAIWLIWQYL
ncbi:pleckstrin homology domain-containing family G member 4B isoform X2 [Drosophila busckii]|uniref:pleckstrin homology domain-containing family G member 4B isoform X2 n=1 Tax=Drosophila busckii TaxID=30019 RepID=UPI00083EBB74|nr:pleckstrin homology domain-containing family G member 4B isoform X2 [Drosophila busckii]